MNWVFSQTFFKFQTICQGLSLLSSVKFGWQTNSHQGPGPIGCSLRALVFKSTYLSAGPICESRLHNATCFLLGVSSLFQHVDLMTTSLKAVFQVYLSQPWILCMQSKTVQKGLLRFRSHFWILCFFLVDCLGRWNQ